MVTAAQVHILVVGESEEEHGYIRAALRPDWDVRSVSGYAAVQEMLAWEQWTGVIVDCDQAACELEKTLELLRREHKDLPIVVLGEEKCCRGVLPQGKTHFWLKTPALLEQLSALLEVVFPRNADLQVDDDLQKRLRLYRSILQHIEDEIFVVDRDYRIVAHNDKLWGEAGAEADDFLGHKCYEVFIQCGRSCAPETTKCPHYCALKMGEVQDFYRETRAEDGPVRTYKGRLSPLYDSQGEFSQVLEIVRDISEMKEMAQELSVSETHLRLALQAVRMGTWEWDIKTNEIFWSDALRSLFEVPPTQKQVTYEMYRGLIHPEDWPHVEENIKAHLEGRAEGDEYHVVHRIVAPNGTEKWIEAWGAVLRDETGTPVRMLGTAVAITEALKMKAALQESEERFRTVVEQASDAIFVHDLEGNFLLVNKMACKNTGYSQNMLLSMRVGQVDVGLKVDGEMQRLWDALQEKSHLTIESRHRHRDGHTFPVEIRLTRITLNGKQGVLAYVRDISMRKREEEKRRALEQQVQHTQKLESLGAMAGGIAHDFNNILMSILGNADLARQQLTPFSPLRENLTEIEKAAQRATQLCAQLLAYAGKTPSHIVPVDLNALIKEMAPILKLSSSGKIRLRFELDEMVPHIKGDAGQLRQIVMNLVVNAVESLRDKSGDVYLRTGARFCDRSYLSAMYMDDHLAEGVYTYLEVRDTGCGMGSDAVARIFEPFYTTKFCGRGLGMPALLGGVRAHKGAIRVSSQPDEGTSVCIFLPTLEREGANRNWEVVGRKKQWLREGCVLLVDDEEAVRAVGMKMLQQMELEVLTAADAREAIRLFEEHAEKIKLVLLDVTMPEVGGQEVLQRLREINPEAPVILCSGYEEGDVMDACGASPLPGFLQKPYTYEALKGALWRFWGSRGDASDLGGIPTSSEVSTGEEP